MAGEYDRLSRRMDDLEETVTEIRLSLAARDEGFRYTNVRLEKIENMLGRVTWLIIGGIVSGAVAFIIAGGLRVPPIT